VPSFVTSVGRYAFGALLEPRTNPNSSKLEYNVGFVLSEQDSEDIFAQMEKALEAKRAGDPRFPKDNSALRFPFRESTKKLEDGTKEVVPGEYLWNFKRNAEIQRKTGEMARNTPPVIYDSLGRIVTAQISRFASGTTGKVVYDVYVYNMAGSKGVSLQLVGFQIAELKRDEVALPTIEGGWVADADEDFAAVLAGNA
jgi:hypothetical protein